MTVNGDTTPFLNSVRVANEHPELIRRSPEKVLGRVPILIDTDEIFRHRVNSDDCRIREHVFYSFVPALSQLRRV
jgi:hypothetical protein